MTAGSSGPSSTTTIAGAGTSTSGPGTGAGAASSASPSTGFFPRRFPRTHARYSRFAATRFGTATATVWRYKRPILIGLGVTYGVVSYASLRIDAYLRDYIHPDSWLVLKVHPGAIVECQSAPNLAQLLNAPSPGEEVPRVIEMFDLCRTLKWAQHDERIRGIFADFSGLHIPSSVAPAALGLAQIEELTEALHEFRIAKKEQRRLARTTATLTEITNETNDDHKEAVVTPSPEAAATETESDASKNEQNSALRSTKSADPNSDSTAVLLQSTKPTETSPEDDEPVTIAWSDSFDSQGDYVLASAFDQIYVQPSGRVQLTGTRAALPFFKRALDWLGITVNAEARREHKSMVSSFVQTDSLPPAQLEDEARLLGELSRSIAHSVGVNRFPDLEPDAAADKVAALLQEGPFTASQAAKLGLITGIQYKREVIAKLGEEPKVRSLNSYARLMKQTMERSLHDDQKVNVAVVYLLGTISNAPGEFSASQAIKGLREAGKDPDVTSIVLRIDSGGGDVVASDSLWDAVRRVQEQYKKPVIASFGNISASGGYYAAASADAILACESTITGSIGVAALRPTFTERFFERLGVRVQTIFAGSNEGSALHQLDERNQKRWVENVDELYDDFLTKVCDGRKISRDVIEDLAGGRVWTGLAAWVACNPAEKTAEGTSGDKNSEEDELKQDKRNDNDASSREQESAVEVASSSPRPDKVSPINVNWTAVDVTKAGEMSTFRIDAVPSASSPLVSTGNLSPRDKSLSRAVPRKEPASSDSHLANADDDDAVAQAFLDEIEQFENVAKATGSSLQGAAAAAATAERSSPSAEFDTESQLAVKAHEEAEASHAVATADCRDGTVDAAQDEKALGPYGKGLIDMIGGIWEAGTLAASMTVEREVADLVLNGMTLEQATNAVRPRAEREVGPGGETAMHLTPQLVRYPKERTFTERYRTLVRNGDHPSLSLFVPQLLSDVGGQVREYVAGLAVQLLVRSWSDPAFVNQLMASIEREQTIKMERNSYVRY